MTEQPTKIEQLFGAAATTQIESGDTMLCYSRLVDGVMTTVLTIRRSDGGYVVESTDPVRRVFLLHDGGGILPGGCT